MRSSREYREQRNNLRKGLKGQNLSHSRHRELEFSDEVGEKLEPRRG